MGGLRAASAAAMVLIEIWSGAKVSLVVPAIFLVLVSAFVGLQVKAARIHVSVELTEEALRQGTETILVREIVKVYPEAENNEASGKELARWQSARALGELVGVPRGRIGIGLKLTNGRTAQAWARRHRQLRAALTPLVQERVEPSRTDVLDRDPDDDAGTAQ
ncbi:putative transmembrane protein [Mycobacterium avium MAV_120709_2344]|nr:putative transmembrane protein [Mycobacterium avium MAV_120709_2344]